MLPKLANRSDQDKESEIEFKTSGRYGVNMLGSNPLDYTANRVNHFAVRGHKVLHLWGQGPFRVVLSKRIEMDAQLLQQIFDPINVVRLIACQLDSDG